MDFVIYVITIYTTMKNKIAEEILVKHLKGDKSVVTGKYTKTPEAKIIAAMEEYAHQQTPIAGSGDLEEAAKQYAAPISGDIINSPLNAVMYHKVIDCFIAGAQYAQSQPVEGWIRVEDRLPELGVRVLVIDDDGDQFVDMRMGDILGEKCDDQWEAYTHWREFPPKP